MTTDRPLTTVIRGALGRELVALGVATTRALRARGWQAVFTELTATHPRRCNTSTALSLAAAELGVRPSEVSERLLSQLDVVVARTAHGSLDAALEALNREARRLLIAAGQGVPLAQVVPRELAADLLTMRVRTLADLRRRGWRAVFAALVKKVPRRKTKRVATVLCAADRGLRPAELRSLPGADEAIAAALQ